MTQPTGIDKNQAMIYAIEMALVARDAVLQGVTFPPGHIRELSQLAEAWVMIYDRLPEFDDSDDSDDPQTGPGSPYPGIKTEGDETPVIAYCGHALPSLLNAGRWLHPFTLDVCDDPPLKAVRDDG